jgi:hypothetical protein
LMVLITIGGVLAMKFNHPKKPLKHTLVALGLAALASSVLAQTAPAPAPA